MDFEELSKKIKIEMVLSAESECDSIETWSKGCMDCVLENCVDLCKTKSKHSEIEKMFCMAFMYKCSVTNINDCPIHPVYNPSESAFRIEREVEVGEYRCDFLCEYERIYLGMLKRSSVIVELDSQKWHETTEKQRMYEKKRERFIQSKGFNILRFTGKEIMEDPFSCVEEVENFLRENLKVVKYE